MKKLVIALVAFTFLFAVPAIAQDKWEYKLANPLSGVEDELRAMALEQIVEWVELLTGEKIGSPGEVTEEMLQAMIFKKVEERLAVLGKESWELVGTIETNFWIFKRKAVEIRQEENIEK